MSITTPTSRAPLPSLPPLQPGDRLTSEEFQRRAEGLPDDVKVELIEGVVYIPPPVFEEHHGLPHSILNAWLGGYWAATPGVVVAANTSLRLDSDNLPQPDAYLRILETHGGRSRRAPDGYVDGSPELIAEIAASSASRDLHDKLNAYRRNGVSEYVVWRTYDVAIDWFALRGGRYLPLSVGGDGIVRSEVFPGLWLDQVALLRSDISAVLRVLQQGLSTPEHGAFVSRLQRATGAPSVT